MKSLKIFILAALFIGLTGTAMAQGHTLSGITWNIAMPAGNLSNFLDKTSFGGFGFETHYFMSDEFALGGSISWNYWSEMTGETIPLKQGALSGTQIRYVNSIPLLLNATYYLGGRRDEIRPFLGLNAERTIFCSVWIWASIRLTTTTGTLDSLRKPASCSRFPTIPGSVLQAVTTTRSSPVKRIRRPVTTPWRTGASTLDSSILPPGSSVRGWDRLKVRRSARVPCLQKRLNTHCSPGRVKWTCWSVSCFPV